MYINSIHFDPKAPNIGTTVRPKYIVFGYMDP